MTVIIDNPHPKDTRKRGSCQKGRYFWLVSVFREVGNLKIKALFRGGLLGNSSVHGAVL